MDITRHRLILARMGMFCILTFAQMNFVFSQMHYVFNGVGDWDNASLWSPSYPGLNIGANDTVTVLPSSELTLIPGIDCHGYFHNQGTMLAADSYYLQINGYNAKLINDGTYDVLFLYADSEFTAVRIVNNGTLDLTNTQGGAAYILTSTLYNTGTITGQGGKIISSSVEVENHGVFDDARIFLVHGTLVNYGSITGRFGVGLLGSTLENEVRNYGKVDISTGQFVSIKNWINDSTFVCAGTVSYDSLINSGRMIITAGSSISTYTGGYLENNGYHKIVHVNDMDGINMNGTIINNDSLVFEIAGPVPEIGFASGITNNSVLLIDDAILVSNNQSILMNASSGTISGNGAVYLSCQNDGSIAPGFSPGILSFTDVIADSNATVVIGLEGTSGPGVVGGYDQVGGVDLTIHGDILIQLEGFAPFHNDSFHIVTCENLIFTGAMILPPVEICQEWEVISSSSGITLVFFAPDSDGDGTCDNEDDCPFDPLKVEPGACGCGLVDIDSDANGVLDCQEVDASLNRTGGNPSEGVRLSGHVLDADSSQLWYIGSRTDLDTVFMLMNRRNDVFQIGTNGAVQMTLDTAGRMGIGRASADHKLEVQGKASKSFPGEWLGNSDMRLKKNIEPINATSALDKLLHLEGITYEWDDHREGRDRPQGTQFGLTAQNIRTVFPSMVLEGADGYLMTSYGTFDPIFIEAIRVLQERVKRVESSNTILKQRLRYLENKLNSLMAHSPKTDNE